jgi:hypothetical protein
MINSAINARAGFVKPPTTSAVRMEKRKIEYYKPMVAQGFQKT